MTKETTQLLHHFDIRMSPDQEVELFVEELPEQNQYSLGKCLSSASSLTGSFSTIGCIFSGS
jgi:hypothetical protein